MLKTFRNVARLVKLLRPVTAASSSLLDQIIVKATLILFEMAQSGVETVDYSRQWLRRAKRGIFLSHEMSATDNAPELKKNNEKHT